MAELPIETSYPPNSENKVGIFYEDIPLSFVLGGYRCHVLRVSFELYTTPIPLHDHSENGWEFHYVSCGKGVLTLENRTYDLHKGTFFITGPYVSHSNTTDSQDPLGEYCIYVKLVPPKSLRQKERETPAFLKHLLQYPSWIGEDTQSMPELIYTLMTELQKRPFGYLTKIPALLQEFLVNASRELPLPAETFLAAESSPLQGMNYSLIERYFLYHYQDLTLENLASELGLSPRQTERFLLRQYGKTFSQKKTDAKMSMALMLLRETRESKKKGNPPILRTITEVAHILNYSSVEHFSAAFRRFYGLSPREWRRHEGII